MTGAAEEEEVDHGRHLAEDRHPFLDERRHPPEDALVETLRRPGGRRAAASRAGRRLDEVVDRQGPDVLPVQPPQLLDVEEGGRRGSRPRAGTAR